MSSISRVNYNSSYNSKIKIENEICLITAEDNDTDTDLSFVNEFESINIEIMKKINSNDDVRRLDSQNSFKKMSMDDKDPTIEDFKSTHIWEDTDKKDDSGIFEMKFKTLKSLREPKKESKFSFNPHNDSGRDSLTSQKSSKFHHMNSQELNYSFNEIKPNVSDLNKIRDVLTRDNTRTPFRTPVENTRKVDPFQILRNGDGNGNGNNEYGRQGQGYSKKKLDEDQRLINLEKILRKKDKRTTVMIRNIPNKYTLQNMMDDININFEGKYDVFYLPIDYENKCNLGFAFINFVDPLHVIYFYDLFRGNRWKRFKSDKVCELAYAKYQGKNALINHFEKGSVLSFDSPEKRPVILSTPQELPKVDLPLKYLNAFKIIYPYCKYSVNGSNFTIDSYFNF